MYLVCQAADKSCGSYIEVVVSEDEDEHPPTPINATARRPPESKKLQDAKGSVRAQQSSNNNKRLSESLRDSSSAFQTGYSKYVSEDHGEEYHSLHRKSSARGVSPNTESGCQDDHPSRKIKRGSYQERRESMKRRRIDNAHVDSSTQKVKAEIVHGQTSKEKELSMTQEVSRDYEDTTKAKLLQQEVKHFSHQTRNFQDDVGTKPSGRFSPRKKHYNIRGTSNSTASSRAGHRSRRFVDLDDPNVSRNRFSIKGRAPRTP